MTMEKEFNEIINLAGQYLEATDPEMVESYKRQILSAMRLIYLDGKWEGLQVGRDIALEAIKLSRP